MGLVYHGRAPVYFPTPGSVVGEAVVPAPTLPVAVRDPKDEPILAAALGGKADYLISGDDDVLVLSGDPGVQPLRIITPRASLGVLGPAEP
jgi:predicted nucleic acid-binding protein